MKTIGLLGGMSWESTVSYYQVINEAVKHRLGGLHSAKICLYSVDFDEIERLQHNNQWSAAADILVGAAQAVEAGGADFLVICTNTMHKVAPEVARAITIPLLHIADATAVRLQQCGVTRVGLLGTQFTMEQPFYKGRLSDKYGIEVLIPDRRRQQIVHKIIYDELCMGTIDEQSRQVFIDIINELHTQGAEAVILGCTEIALLVQQQHSRVPLYDTAQIHAEAAVNEALDI